MHKTLLVTIDYPPSRGGVATYLLHLARNLPANKLVVLAPQANDNSDHEEFVVIRKRLLWRRFWPAWLPMILVTWRAIVVHRIEKLWVSHILPVGTVALVMKKLLQVPYVVSTHGMDICSAQRSWRKRRLMRTIFSHADMITANSRFTAKLLTDFGVAQEKITILFPCPNPHLEFGENCDLWASLCGARRCTKSTAYSAPRFQRHISSIFTKLNLLENGRKDGANAPLAPILLTVGRLVKRKGHDNVILALPKILEKIPNLLYVIVGDGENKYSLEELVEERKLQKSVYFAGNVTDEELAHWYKQADIFIMPAREINGDVEGFGIVFLEAALSRLPVIAGRSGGVSVAVLDNQTGLVVDPENI